MYTHITYTYIYRHTNGNKSKQNCNIQLENSTLIRKPGKQNSNTDQFVFDTKGNLTTVTR